MKCLAIIEQLVNEIKLQEKELRTSELNMLISQINPHFLYNTLDTIYMLARMNKEETTMRMIQALSKYLRLCLSKGSDIVSVEDELENVKSYMEIQQIRNVDLFEYEIDCQVNAKENKILKLILQPLVENAVKYGFSEIYEGGYIRIRITEENDVLVLSVYNTGMPMNKDMVEKINGLTHLPISQIKEAFPDKKHGYGVFNILTRLRLKYGDKITYYYETTDASTTCTIKVPKEVSRNHEKQHIKKTIRSMFILLLMICLLTGCKTSEKKLAEESKEPVKISIILTVDPSTGTKNEQKVVEAFNKKYKGTYELDVDWIVETEADYRQNLKRLNATDELPDIITDLRMLPSFYQKMMSENRIADLTPYIDADEEWSP